MLFLWTDWRLLGCAFAQEKPDEIIWFLFSVDANCHSEKHNCCHALGYLLHLMLELKCHISFWCSWSQPYWLGLSDFGLILLTVFPSLCASSWGVPSRPPSPPTQTFFFFSFQVSERICLCGACILFFYLHRIKVNTAHACRKQFSVTSLS